MEQEISVETFETSLALHIWVERGWIVVLLLTGIISIITHLGIKIFFEVLLGIFLFVGVVALGFVGIVAHIKYYFNIEKNRTVELYADRIVISLKGQIVENIPKNDIIEIELCDRFRVGNFNPSHSLLDNFYYLTVISMNQDSVILTCLLDIKLKKKIASWYGHEFQHKYKFLPFP